MYSGYSVSGRFAPPRTERAAAILASAAEANTLCYFESENEAAQALSQPAQKKALCACRILFAGGVGKIYLLTMAELSQIEQKVGIGCIITENISDQNLQALKSSVNESSKNRCERLLIVGADTAAEALNAAGVINHERGIVCAPACKTQGDDNPRGLYAACAMAARLLGENDPVNNLSGAVMEDIAAASELEENVVQNLIANGVCVMESIANRVECVRAVTTRTMHNGERDYSMRSVNTVLIIDDVMRTLRSGLALLVKGMRVGAASQAAIEAQATVLLAAKRDDGILESFSPPVVKADSSDPSVCSVEVSFNVAHVVEQIHLSTQVRL